MTVDELEALCALFPLATTATRRSRVGCAIAARLPREPEVYLDGDPKTA
jgi:hypothetical protein